MRMREDEQLTDDLNLKEKKKERQERKTAKHQPHLSKGKGKGKGKRESSPHSTLRQISTGLPDPSPH
jgi:hypothetical protein